MGVGVSTVATTSSAIAGAATISNRPKTNKRTTRRIVLLKHGPGGLAAGLARRATRVLLERLDQLALAHVRAALDAGLARVVVELRLGLAGVDASVGPTAAAPCRGAAACRLGVGRALAPLGLPVVA